MDRKRLRKRLDVPNREAAACTQQRELRVSIAPAETMVPINFHRIVPGDNPSTGGIPSSDIVRVRHEGAAPTVRLDSVENVGEH